MVGNESILSTVWPLESDIESYANYLLSKAKESKLGIEVSVNLNESVDFVWQQGKISKDMSLASSISCRLWNKNKYFDASATGLSIANCDFIFDRCKAMLEYSDSDAYAFIVPEGKYLGNVPDLKRYHKQD